MANVKYVIQDREDNELSSFIAKKLGEFNTPLYGEANRQELNCFSFAKDNKEPVAGLIGHTCWGWLYIRLLWVNEEYRKTGIGRELMAKAESTAKGRNCQFSYIDTFNPKVKKFYESLGYSLFCELKDFPPGHQRYFLKKQL